MSNNLRSVLAKFENTIHENEKSGVSSGMYLSNVASRGPRVPLSNAHARRMSAVASGNASVASASSAYANRQRRASLVGTLAERKTLRQGSIDGTNSTTDSTVEDQDGFGEVIALSSSDRRSMLAKTMSERSIIKEDGNEPDGGNDPFYVELPATDANGFPIAPPPREKRASAGRQRLRQTSLTSASHSSRKVGGVPSDASGGSKEPLSSRTSAKPSSSRQESPPTSSSRRGSDKSEKELSDSRHGSSGDLSKPKTSSSSRPSGTRSSRQTSIRSGGGDDATDSRRSKPKEAEPISDSRHGDKPKSSSRSARQTSIRSSATSNASDGNKEPSRRSSESRRGDKERTHKSAGEHKSSSSKSSSSQLKRSDRQMSDVERLASRSRKPVAVVESSTSHHDSFLNDSESSNFGDFS
ncbi:hypothetical protein MPSEU_000831300 [Mayamaea pseudoterrestris]|nr:hypothetical protein MPSEU_000831300 [Mayamaea pseudoterrestris]